MVTLPLFRPDGVCAQRDLVRLDHFPLGEQLQRAFLLKDDNAISVKGLARGLRHAESTQPPDPKASQNQDSHAGSIEAQFGEMLR